MTEYTLPPSVRLGNVTALWHSLQGAPPLSLNAAHVGDCDSAAIGLLLALKSQGHRISPEGLSPRLADLAYIYEVQDLLQAA